MNTSFPLMARIAIADDDATQRMLLKRLVEHLGHQVVWVAEDGQRAIEQLSEQKVDVVLMDLDMPEVDGLEAAEHFSQLGIPVVLISGVPDAEHLIVEIEPIVSRLTKPVSQSAISRVIAEALKRI